MGMPDEKNLINEEAIILKANKSGSTYGNYSTTVAQRYVAFHEIAENSLGCGRLDVISFIYSKVQRTKKQCDQTRTPLNITQKGYHWPPASVETLLARAAR